MSVKKKQQKVEVMTIDQFKTFIKGLSFFDADWTPSKDQWEHIKLLIDSLKVEAPVVINQAPRQSNGGALLPAQPMSNQGEAVAREDYSHAPGQRSFLGGQPTGQPAVDSRGQPVAVNPNTAQKFGTETVLPSARATGSEFL